jgi:hypothetical protein
MRVKGGRRVGFTTLPPCVSRLSKKCGSLDLAQPYGLTGISLPFTFTCYVKMDSPRWKQLDGETERERERERERSLLVWFSLDFVFQDGGDIFLRNVGWLSMDYTALYPVRENVRCDWCENLRDSNENKVITRKDKKILTSLSSCMSRGGGGRRKKSDSWTWSGAVGLLFHCHRVSCVPHRKYGVRKTARPLAGWMATDRFLWLHCKISSTAHV